MFRKWFSGRKNEEVKESGPGSHILQGSLSSWRFPILITTLQIVSSTLKVHPLYDVPVRIIFAWKCQTTK